MREINVDSAEWDEAYDMALQRAREEGDVDIDYPDDEELVFKWAEEYYYDLVKGKNVANEELLDKMIDSYDDWVTYNPNAANFDYEELSEIYDRFKVYKRQVLERMNYNA